MEMKRAGQVDGVNCSGGIIKETIPLTNCEPPRNDQSSRVDGLCAVVRREDSLP